MNMALAMSEANTFDIMTAAALIEDKTTSRSFIIIINQAAYIPDLEQHESLLHSDQAQHHRAFINDIAKCFHDYESRPGCQNIQVDGCTIPLDMME